MFSMNSAVDFPLCCAICGDFADLHISHLDQDWQSKLRATNEQLIRVFIETFTNPSEHSNVLETPVSFCDRCAKYLKELSQLQDKLKCLRPLQDRATKIKCTLAAIVIETDGKSNRNIKGTKYRNELDSLDLDDKIEGTKQKIIHRFVPWVSLGNRGGDRLNLQEAEKIDLTEGLFGEGLHDDGLNSEDIEDSFNTRETDLNTGIEIAGKSCDLRIDNVRTLSTSAPPTAESSKPLFKLAVDLTKPFLPTDGKYRVHGKYYIVVSQGQCKCTLCGRTSIDFRVVVNHIKDTHVRLGAPPMESIKYPQLGRRRKQQVKREKLPKEPRKRIRKRVRERKKNSSDGQTKEPKVPKARSRPQAKPKDKQDGGKGKKKSQFVLIEEGKYLYREKYEVTRSEDGRFICQTCGNYSSLKILHVCNHIRYKHILNSERKRQWRSRNPKWKETSPGKYTDGKYTIEELEDGSFKCLECGKVGHRRYSVQIHIGMTHFQDERFGREGRQRTIYVRSKKINTDKYEYQGFTFQYDPSTKKYSCDSCNYARSDKFRLNKHLAIAHCGLESAAVSTVAVGKNSTGHGSRICEKCGKTFSHQFYLEHHRRYGHGPIRFTCQQCGKGFTQNFLYRKHVMTHRPAELRRQHQCEYCGSSFIQFDSLRRHIATKHKGELLKCSKCGEGFKTNHRRKIHYRMVHKGLPRKRSCDLCSKEFCLLYDLKNHRKTHTGETFDCKDCKEPFTTAARLRLHVKKFHKADQTTAQ